MERLRLNKKEGIFGGVCSGLGIYYKIDPVIFRLLFVIGATMLSGSLFWLYLILLLIIPE